MKKVLIADNLPDQCVSMLESAGLLVSNKPGLNEDDLREAVRDVSGIICRSGAKITADVLQCAEQLEAVCRAGVGVDTIDVDEASRRGVVVMNTPGANTTSTAEHAFALLLALARNIGPAYIAMREGRWDKKKFVGSQLAGSTLGVAGLGRVGQTVARRAIAFGMTVVAHDPYVSRETAESAGVKLVDTLEEMLPQCDYFTVHVPENKDTEGMIGAEEIELMKDGACIINCARGSIVDQDAVLAAIEKGKLAKAAFDVYVQEPPESMEFARSDRVLATPHLGASTEEAQLAVATEAAEELIEALLRRHYRNAVNVSLLPPEEMKALMPYCELARHLGRLVGQLNQGRVQALEVACKGELAHRNLDPVVQYGTMGVIETMLGSDVNIVSAPHLAEDRGINVTSSRTLGQASGFSDLVEVKITTDRGMVEAAGTVFAKQHPRIVSIEGYQLEVSPEGHVLIVINKDVPGVIGKVGEILGAAKVNIARMGCGRHQAGGKAMLALNVDSPCAGEVLEAVRGIGEVERVLSVEFD